MIVRWSALEPGISTLASMLPTQGGASIRWGRRDQTSFSGELPHLSPGLCWLMGPMNKTDRLVEAIKAQC